MTFFQTAKTPSPVVPLAVLAPAERILVVRNRFIGDTVLAIPFLRNLRRRFPNAVIDVLVEPRSGDVLADCPYKDALITWTRPQRVRGIVPRSLFNLFTTARWLRSRNYTRAYVLKRSFSSALVVAWAGIRHRVGFALEMRSVLLTRAVPMRRNRHEVELFLDLLRADGIEVDSGYNENWVSQTLATQIDMLLSSTPTERPRVFIAPQSTDNSRQWPLERMAEVIQSLVDDHGCDIFFCGGPDDHQTHQTIRSMVGWQVSKHLHDYSSGLSLRQTGALLSRMDLCLSIDTGLRHIAASFGVPVVSLFGPTDPNQWHPWQTEAIVIRSTKIRTSPIDRLRQWLSRSPQAGPVWPAGVASIRDIEVEEVIGSLSKMLRQLALKTNEKGSSEVACSQTSLTAGQLPLGERKENLPNLAGGQKTIDLRNGTYRYQVFASRESMCEAALPATKPLAHAH